MARPAASHLVLKRQIEVILHPIFSTLHCLPATTAMRYFLTAFILLFCNLSATAQTDTSLWHTPATKAYSFLRTGDNKITNDKKLHPIFERLFELRNGEKGRVTILHIGDSHIQADMMTSVLRDGFQQRFGDAGRGMLFPYQLAKSNGPADMTSSSNITWQYNRLAHPEIDIRTGISGFGIHTTQARATIHMQLKPIDSVQHYFNELSFFMGPEPRCYTLTAPGISPLSGRSSSADSPLIFNTETMLTEFDLSTCADARGDGTFSMYGVSLRNKGASGVLYHTIGVNGAQYEQYTNVSLFWQQLRHLGPELYIVSMGTNEAQNRQFSEDTFLLRCNAFLAQVRAISPSATLLITSPAGSYFKGKAPNAVLEKVHHALTRFCNENDLPYWDLYHISGGKAAIPAWKKNKLFSHDLVHYSRDGYQLQGHLLLNALAHSYNSYVATRPKTPKKKTRTTPGKRAAVVPKPTKTTDVPKTPESAPAEMPDTPRVEKHHIIKVKTEDR